MWLCKVKDTEFHGLSEVSLHSPRGVQKGHPTAWPLLQWCAYMKCLHFYIKCQCWFPDATATDKREAAAEKKKKDEEKEEGGQRRRRRTKEKQKNLSASQWWLVSKPTLYFCFVSEEELSVQPLTSSGTYCSYWMAGGHWCPSVTYQGHGDQERLGDTTSLHGHTWGTGSWSSSHLIPTLLPPSSRPTSLTGRCLSLDATHQLQGQPVWNKSTRSLQSQLYFISVHVTTIHQATPDRRWSPGPPNMPQSDKHQLLHLSPPRPSLALYPSILHCHCHLTLGHQVSCGLGQTSPSVSIQLPLQSLLCTIDRGAF